MRTIALLALGLAAVAACTNAPPTEQGGDPRFDAQAPPLTTTQTSCGGDPNADAGSGHAYSDLYRDYFGPTGKASCTFNGTCHGNANDQGAASSNYVCGPSAAECYQGMIAGGLFLANDKTTPPEDTLLYSTLRDCSHVGSTVKMPQQPSTVYFTAADLQRIHDWLAEGAPND